MPTLAGETGQADLTGQYRSVNRAAFGALPNQRAFGELYLYLYIRDHEELEAMTVDLIEVMTGAAPDDVAYDIRLPDTARAHLDASANARQAEAEARSTGAAELRAAARALHDQGIPLRDVGQLLGVSFQRAHQLVA